MNKRTRRITIICLVLLIVAATVFFLAGRVGKKTKTVYLTEKVSRGDMENSVTATGTVEPLEKVEVGTQVSGIIDKIYVDYNSSVHKGDVIAELDKTVLQTEYESAKLSVESNRTEYEYQKKSYERTKALYEKKMASESDYETAEYNYRRAEIAYKQAQAQAQKALTNLGYATIYSPIDGVVISKAVETGQTVASSFNTPTLFTIANDLRRIQVVADVDEADIGEVTEHSEVSFSVDAYPNEVFSGVVNQVRMEAITNNNVVTYEVVIHADNPDLKLKPGMTANISIYSMRRLNALRVPVKASRFRPEPAGGAPAPKGERPERPDVSAGERPDGNSDTPAGERSNVSAGERSNVSAGERSNGNTAASAANRSINGNTAAPAANRPERPDASAANRSINGNTAAPAANRSERPEQFEGDSAGNYIMVFVLPEGESAEPGQTNLQPRRVKIGVTDRIYYEVLEGLEEGETVCVGTGTKQQETKQASAERSPFMPTPPGGGQNKRSGGK